MKKISSLTVLIFFISAQCSPLFAEQIELTDNELDQIHAGGLNFNYGSFYGNLSSLAENSSQKSETFDVSKYVASPSFSTTSGGSQNILNVSDSSQQALSALVNINAAGSIVPVLLNLTVIMGDNFGNINNSNELNLSNYTTFQVQ